MRDARFTLGFPPECGEDAERTAAAVHALISESSCVELDRLRAIWETCHSQQAIQAFYEGLDNALQVGDKAARSVWAQTVLSRIRSEPWTSSDEDTVKHLEWEAQAWQRFQEPFAVLYRRWSMSWSPPREEFLFLTSILLRIDQDAWIDAVGSLPTPSLMRHALPPFLIEDAEMIKSLVERTPFASTRMQEPRAVVLPLLIEAITIHSRLLHQAVRMATKSTPSQVPTQEDALRSLVEHEIPERLRAVFDAVAKREDHQEIASRLLVHLVSAWLISQDWAQKATLENAVTTLSHGGVSWNSVQRAFHDTVGLGRGSNAEIDALGQQDEVEERDPGLVTSVVPYFLSALLLDWSCPTSEGGQGVLKWLSDIFVSDEDIHQIETSTRRGFIVRMCALLLRRVKETHLSWCELYAELEHNRRRAQFSRDKDPRDWACGSRLLVLIGFYYCEELKNGSNNSKIAAEELFWLVFGEALRLWLTTPHQFTSWYLEALTSGFAFFPTLFEENLTDQLGKAIARTGGSAEVVVLAAKRVAECGRFTGDLRDVFSAAGYSLDASLRELKIAQSLGFPVSKLVSEAVRDL